MRVTQERVRKAGPGPFIWTILGAFVAWGIIFGVVWSAL